MLPSLRCWCSCSLTCFSLNELGQDVPPLTFTNILLITYTLISTCCSFSLPQPIFSVLAGWQSQILLLWLVIQFHFFKHSSFFLPSYQPTLLILFPLSSSHIHPWQEPLPQQLPIPTFVPPFLIPQPLQRHSWAELDWNMFHLKNKLPKSTWPEFQWFLLPPLYEQQPKKAWRWEVMHLF